MIWIGFNKNDEDQRKFEFDDSVVITQTDPPQYTVRFLDNNEVSSVVCSNVFKLKPVKPFNKKQNLAVIEKPVLEQVSFDGTPVQTDEKTDDELQLQLQMDIANELRPVWEKKQIPVAKHEPEPEPEPVITTKKTRGRKKKTDDTSSVTQPVQTIQTVSLQKHKYEYKTILVDLENVGLVQDKLNELGEKCWELVNFSVIQSLLPNKSRLFCILKRNKQ